MNIGILTTNQVEDDQRLLEVAIQKGHTASLLDLQFVSIELNQGKAEIYYKTDNITDNFDTILPRINVTYTDYGINVVQHFLSAKTYVSEQPEALRLGRDKFKCLQRLLDNGLPFPKTGIAYSGANFFPLYSDLKFPLVIKLIESTEGAGIFLAKTIKEAENFIKTFGLLKASFLLQEFVAESVGVDYRAFVVGDKIVAAMCRESQDDDFRANVSLGGHSHAVELTPEEQDMVLQAARSIDINVAGVDFLRSSRGPLLLEVNVSPDFTGQQGIERVPGVDVAGEIINFAVQQPIVPQRTSELTLAVAEPS